MTLKGILNWAGIWEAGKWEFAPHLYWEQQTQIFRSGPWPKFICIHSHRVKLPGQWCTCGPILLCLMNFLCILQFWAKVLAMGLAGWSLDSAPPWPKLRFFGASLHWTTIQDPIPLRDEITKESDQTWFVWNDVHLPLCSRDHVIRTRINQVKFQFRWRENYVGNKYALQVCLTEPGVRLKCSDIKRSWWILKPQIHFNFENGWTSFLCGFGLRKSRQEIKGGFLFWFCFSRIRYHGPKICHLKSFSLSWSCRNQQKTRSHWKCFCCIFRQLLQIKSWTNTPTCIVVPERWL